MDHNGIKLMMKDKDERGRAWMDVSVGIEAGMLVWPDDPHVEVRRLQSIDHGDEANLTSLSCSAHLGTHIDAPSHYIRQAHPIDAMPTECMIGMVRVVDTGNVSRVKVETLEEHDRKYPVEEGQMLFFRTQNSEGRWPSASFDANYVDIAPDAASWLAHKQVRVVGIDYLSVGAMGEEGSETHRRLLGAGIWIIEGLDLRQAAAGTYEMVALPLKLVGADGAPARVLLRAL